MTRHKLCKLCGADKPLSAFYIERRRHDNSELIRAICKDCTKAKSKAWRITNPEKRKQVALRHYRKIRLEAISHYSNGTFCCACCGESHIEFLAIDHVNGDGASHRRNVRGGPRTIFNWLKRHGYPKGFQVLCANCNWAKGQNRKCPHELEREGKYSPMTLAGITQQTRRGIFAQKLLTHKGKTQNIADWAREYSIPPYMLRQRLFRDGWTMERALTQRPTRTRRRISL